MARRSRAKLMEIVNRYFALASFINGISAVSVRAAVPKWSNGLASGHSVKKPVA